MTATEDLKLIEIQIASLYGDEGNGLAPIVMACDGESISLSQETVDGTIAVQEVAIWEHTVYEIERLSAALTLALSRDSLGSYKVKAPVGAMGNNVVLPLAVSLELGQPPIGSNGDALQITISTKLSSVSKSKILYFGIVSTRIGVFGMLDVDQARSLATQLDRWAEILAPLYISWI